MTCRFPFTFDVDRGWSKDPSLSASRSGRARKGRNPGSSPLDERESTADTRVERTNPKPLRRWEGGRGRRGARIRRSGVLEAVNRRGSPPPLLLRGGLDATSDRSKKPRFFPPGVGYGTLPCSPSPLARMDAYPHLFLGRVRTTCLGSGERTHLPPGIHPPRHERPS